ncbi:MAG TPA: molybdopterin-synthase adenylyltransferase MoeB [Moraxellaceae bacterium]|nr:molybdopterin-synthase adenylyltransferase MoeB [Moraxellaceae bacterium]
MLNDEELLRYSRQIMLPQVDVAGQEALKAARVLVVGVGGIGCPVAQYLAAAGVGTLVLADFDTVDTTNLQRQVLFTAADVGRHKTTVAADRLRAQNPHVHIDECRELLSVDNLRPLVDGVDLVIDGCDNFPTRDAVNAACVAAGKPLVSAAAIGMGAQLAVFDSRVPTSPCYRCLYPDLDEAAASCAESGVLAPVVGVVGALAATEALKILTGAGQPLVGRLWLWEALGSTMRTLGVPRDPACPVCAVR